MSRYAFMKETRQKRYVSYKVIASILEMEGFKAERQKGSHVQFFKDGNRVTVPNHGKKDIAEGTLSSIILQMEEAGINREEFKKNIGMGRR
jgi:predicted RNA binding protein YcfA (HicA-like mRNA interferase family)